MLEEVRQAAQGLDQRGAKDARSERQTHHPKRKHWPAFFGGDTGMHKVLGLLPRKKKYVPALVR